MSLMILAAMMMAQASAETAPQATPAQQQPAAKKQKAKQICEMVEVTGSRSKRRVCRDESGNLDLGPGIHSGSYGQDSGTQSSSTPGSN